MFSKIKKLFSGLRGKLLLSFLTVIGCIVIAGGFFMGADYLIIEKYRATSTIMIAEYRLAEDTDSLIENFNGLIKYNKDQDRIMRFIDTRTELNALLATLDDSITEYDRRVIYLGLRNNIQSVIAECDRGVNAVLAGNYEEVTASYDEARRQNTFVKENATNLLMKQLEYAQSLQEKINQVQAASQIISIIFFFAVTISCVLYAFLFSRRLISPLTALTKLAKKVKRGDLHAISDIKLLETGDEVGVLAESFDTMVTSLSNSIHKLQNYNEKLVAAQREITIESQEIANQVATITELKKLDRLKNEVLNIATHELKTPLISIVGLSEIMQKQGKNFTEEQKKYLGIIHDEGAKLTGLIRNMLTSIKQDNGQMVGAKEEFDIRELILSLKTSLDMIVKRTSSKVEMRLPETGVKVISNRESISQVIYNLVDNAVKYGPENQIINLTLDLPYGRFARVLVADSGAGISTEAQQKLFLKFSQLEPSLNRSKEGMGLGLYICKKTIEELGGIIGVDSQLGKGSTFYFTVLRADDQTSSSPSLASK